MKNTPTGTHSDQDPNVNAFKAAGTSPPRGRKTVQRLDDREIRELKETAGIRPYQQRLDLKKSGKEYKARCPFHNDRHPSLSVYEDRGEWRFKCFACGASGDVIEFLVRKDGLQFVEALEELSNKQLGNTRVATRRSSKFKSAEHSPKQLSKRVDFDRASSCVRVAKLEKRKISLTWSEAIALPDPYQRKEKAKRLREPTQWFEQNRPKMDAGQHWNFDEDWGDDGEDDDELDGVTAC